MSRCGSCSWTWGFHAKHSRLTASSRRLLHDMFNVILTYSRPTVSPIVPDLTNSLVASRPGADC